MKVQFKKEDFKMTPKEKRSQIRLMTMELIDDLPNWLPAKLDKVLSCGAIDFEDCECNYQLPKQIMCALSEEIAFQYKPHSKEGKKVVKNLAICI